MNTILKQSVSSKSGITINSGEQVKIAFDCGSNSRFSITSKDGRRVISRNTERFGRKVPSIKTLEKWEQDSFCNSVFGEKVEPDGTDENGAPSWLLFLGLI